MSMNKMHTIEQVGGSNFKLRLPSWLRRSQKKPKNNSHLIPIPRKPTIDDCPEFIKTNYWHFIDKIQEHVATIDKLETENKKLQAENEKLHAEIGSLKAAKSSRRAAHVATTTANVHPLSEVPDNEGLHGVHPLIKARNTVADLTSPVAGATALFNTSSAKRRGSLKKRKPVLAPTRNNLLNNLGAGAGATQELFESTISSKRKLKPSKWSPNTVNSN